MNTIKFKLKTSPDFDFNKIKIKNATIFFGIYKNEESIKKIKNPELAYYRVLFHALSHLLIELNY